jgi:hypothetical protein
MRQKNFETGEDEVRVLFEFYPAAIAEVEAGKIKEGHFTGFARLHVGKGNIRVIADYNGDITLLADESCKSHIIFCDDRCEDSLGLGFIPKNIEADDA